MFTHVILHQMKAKTYVHRMLFFFDYALELVHIQPEMDDSDGMEIVTCQTKTREMHET